MDIIKIKNLKKVYAIYKKPIDRLKEAIDIRHKIYHRDFFALDDINFSVKKGESFGIIGINGSGKSTLLKIITGVLSKTSGEIIIDGKIAALLELGAGFNVDYTGIENIYMNGTMMGFTRKEMDEKIEKIINFADIGDFIERPVKEYSSGMFVRLAFAISIAVEPDILIVDEALSVGDIFFQTKCYKRMEELKQHGTTIVMVTHDLGAVIKYCDRVTVLNKGKQIAIGTPHEMVDLYKKILVGQEPDISNIQNDNKIDKKNDISIKDIDAKNIKTTDLLKNKMTLNKEASIYGDMKAEFIDFGIVDAKLKPSSVLVKGEEFSIIEKIKINEDIEEPIFTWTIKDKRGTELTGTNTMLEKISTGSGRTGDIYEVHFKQKMRLQGGEYLLSMSCTSFEKGELKVHHRMYDVISINVLMNENKVGVFDSESEVFISKK